MRRCHLGLGAMLWIAACGQNDPAGPRPDAGPAVTIDAPAPPPPPDIADAAVPDAAELVDARTVGSLEAIDWRTTRGEPLSTTTVTAPTGELFALTDDGFVLRGGCDDPLGCTYSWHDGAGAETRRREHLIGVTLTSVSPDGRSALLLAADEAGSCEQDDLRFVVDRGTLQLVDLATGAADLNLVLRSNSWSAPAFTPDSRWFFAAPIADGRCLPARLGWRSVVEPFAEAPGLDGGFIVALMADAHRWIGFRGSDHALGVVDPDVAGSFVTLSAAEDPFDAAGGWVHAYAGAHQLVHEILSLSPTGDVRRTPVEADEDWFPTQAFGRWVRVCSLRQMPGFRDCRIIDVLGERPPANVRIVDAPDHRDDAVLIGEGAFVFVEHLAEDLRAVRRLDLVTGALHTLHAGDGTLSPVGDGEAALLFVGGDGGDALLVEAAREQLLAHDVRFILNTPRLPFFSLVRQHDVVLIVSAAGDTNLSLDALDLRTRRLARLTDRLVLAPRFDAASCAQPAVTRHAGGEVDGLAQDGTQLFFVEKPADGEKLASMWVLPIDLSAPPRRLAAVTEPTLCHPPLTLSGGGRVGFLEDDADTGEVHITIGTP